MPLLLPEPRARGVTHIKPERLIYGNMCIQVNMCMHACIEWRHALHSMVLLVSPDTCGPTLG